MKAYQARIQWAMDKLFSLRTTRRKSTDLPWKIRRRKRLYKKYGITDIWRNLKKSIEDELKEREKKYMEMRKQQLTAEDANRSFFRLVKAFNTPEKPQSFDVRALRPWVPDQDVAEELADYFNRIYHEFEPLRESEIPGDPPPGPEVTESPRSLDQTQTFPEAEVHGGG